MIAKHLFHTVLLSITLTAMPSAVRADDAKPTAGTERLSGTDLLAQEHTQVQVPRGKARVGEQINWQVISSGGVINGGSASFGLSGTVSQTAVGVGSSASFRLSHGFWQEFGGEGPCDADLLQLT